MIILNQIKVQKMKLSIVQKLFESNLCDYKDAYILARGDITVRTAPETQLAFKN